MSVRIALRHRIVQRFARPISLSTHWLRLRPAPTAEDRVTAYSLKVDADPHFINWVRDPFENYLARLDLPEPVPRLGFDLEMIAELEPVNPFDFLVEYSASNFPFSYDKQLRRELAPYLAVPEIGPRFNAWLEELEIKPGYTVAFLTLLIQHLHVAVQPSELTRPGRVDIEAMLEKGVGSPWDVAWMATLTLRSLGLAARFVAGYCVNLAGEALASFHAWTEVYLPGGGWIGLDPAGGLFADEGYIPLTAAPDPLRAVPIVGYREVCDETLFDQVEVRRLSADAPRWPLSAAQWNDLLLIGDKVEADLGENELELSVQQNMAFVSAVEPDLDEWNNSALGPTKRRVGEDLLMRLRRRLGAGGVLQVTQGEWFAGEPFPRWRLGCWYRSDGQAVCRDGARIGWPTYQGPVLTHEHAERFGKRLAQALGIAESYVVPALEDGLYKQWRDMPRPDFVPDANSLRDPDLRRALALQLSHEAAELRGYLLPLRHSGKSGWSSGSWSNRRGAIYLLPGDSPMGYRLPLEGLPLATQKQQDIDRCQFEERALLPELHGEVARRMSAVTPSAPSLVQADELDSDAPQPRTAVCMEVRDGRLHCFLPPVTHLEQWLELVAAVELAAESIDVAVVLEGYEPPEDHRLRRIVVEPDAGVLSVQLPTLSSNADLNAATQVAFEEATGCGLRAERIMLDGGRFPPGVGAPLVLGAERPNDSPFLCQPAILRSLIAFWQRHPSLSYLFAGRDIGPTSGSPRIDEGRDEALYELAIALERIPDGEVAEPWLVDRILRHLLTNPAGDMRKAEIRVDQLYDPARAGRRLGRVIVNSFEMPPNLELYTLQMTLVRALIARFARFPEPALLQRWSDQLVDRFLLPRLLWEDFRDVLKLLEVAGYAFDENWFQPLLNQRFPHIGTVEYGDITMSLRQAHEPWPVLAEEVTAAGVSRFLDTSLDRVQVLGSGLIPGRYALECNGERVPMQATGVNGEYVAGVRFKTWNPPSTLHPIAPAVSALVFDLIDIWSGKVMGGFTYYPAKPAGWGNVGAPMPPAEPGQGPDQVTQPRMNYGTPTYQRGGRFDPRGSGRDRARPRPEKSDLLRPFLLDLSFPD